MTAPKDKVGVMEEEVEKVARRARGQGLVFWMDQFLLNGLLSMRWGSQNYRLFKERL